MSFDAHRNFALTTLASGINNSALSLTVATGGAALRLPEEPFNATLWNSTDYPNSALDPLREIVRVTAIATDVLTITRAQEGTTANAHNITGKTYSLQAGPTAKTFTDIETRFATVAIDYAATVTTDASLGSTFEIGALTGNLTLANPTNPIDGQAVTWLIQQDGTGGRTVTLGNKFVIPSSATTPLAWSTSANKTDIFAAKYRLSADSWNIVSLVPGY